MLAGILWVGLTGFFGGQLAKRLKLPALVGMILVGILLGPQAGGVLGPAVLASAGAFRTIAVMVILMKAGLGLDRDKLRQQSTVALRLGFLPGVCEAVVVAIASIVLFKFDLPTGLLLGCILGAESPAVIVPGMLRLKQLGWGVRKGIADAILTGSALSDVMLLLLFSLLLAFLTQGNGAIALPGGLQLSAIQRLPLQVVMQISLGIFFGWLAARLLVLLLVKQNWTQNAVQDSLVTSGVALGLVLGAERWPLFSGYLAVMATGFFLVSLDAPLARRLRGGFATLWEVAQIFLFVLLGASIQLTVLENTLWSGLGILALGTLLGRMLGWWLSTLGSNWTWREKLFLLPGNSAKATVQAAIGAIPLAQGIEGGEVILAIAALSILVTAPLGAWAIPTFAPKLLERGAVDPTKVLIEQRVLLLAAVDASAQALPVVRQAAALARRADGEVLVLHVRSEGGEEGEIEVWRSQLQPLLADIRHRFVVLSGDVAETIAQVAAEQNVSEIVMGRGDRFTALAFLTTTPITTIQTPKAKYLKPNT